MTDRVVVVRLRADIADLQRKFAQAKQTTVDTAKAVDGYVQKNKDSINSLSNTAGVLGGILTATAVLAVKKFADFDQAISGVKASGDDAANSIDALRQAAIDAGAKTVFSATESANAIENMAKAGVKATDILGGGLTGALDLASAGTLDVADAAEIAATTMNQFGLKGKDVTHIADVLAAAAGKANGEVSDFGLAMKYVGPVASQLGVSLDETAGTLALLAQNGILADSAGTGLRGVMQALTAPSKAASKAMEEYNITAFDARGKFIGLAGVAGQLHDRLGGLDEATRSAALGQIFGNEQITTARVLYKNGAAAVKDWTNQVNDQGFAAETAATKLDNLKGDIEQLGGSLETALIGAGEGANGPLRALVQQITDVVNAFSTLPDAAQSGLLAIVGGAGLIGLGVAGFGKLVIGISEAKVAIQALGVSAKGAGIAVAGIGGALTIATLALSAWADMNATAEARITSLRGSLDESTGAITKNTREVIANDLTARSGWWVFKKESAASQAKILGLSLDTLTDAITGNKDAIEEVNAATAKGALRGKDLADAAKAAGVGSLDYANAQRTVREEVEALSGSLGKSKTDQEDVNKAVNDGTDAQAGMQDAVVETTDSIDDQVEALAKLVQGQSDLAGVALSVRAAQSGLEAAYDDATAAIEKNGATLDITTEAGRANQSALDDIAKSGYDLVESMQANGSTQEELQASLQGTRDNFINVATQMGLTQDQAVALADQLNLIPANINTAVTVDVGPAQAAINSFIINNTGKRIQIGVDTVGGTTYSVNGKGPKFNAEGGYQSGPGTGTSDSILSWLSNGEYVIKADTVARQPRSYWDNLNAGRFATGGPVGWSGPTSSSSDGRAVGPQVTMMVYTSDPLGAAIAATRRIQRLGA